MLNSLAMNVRSFSLLALAAGISIATTGCGMNGTSVTQAAAGTGATPATATVNGMVHGGNQPVTNSTIKLYAVGAGGYGVGATSLLTTTVTSGSTGFFTITGDYTCPTPATQVYIVASGGNPGLTPTGSETSVNNTNLAMMAALGTCPAGGNLLASLPFITINEVTTVAAVAALQQFMAVPATGNTLAPDIGAPTTAYATGTSVGSVKSAITGMANAFITAQVLANPATGLSPNTNYPYATPETAKLNTIADMLAYCVNSDPTQTNNCSTLLTDATPNGQTAAADTIQAAWYILQNPINNLTTLYGLVPGTGAPFPPTAYGPGATNGANVRTAAFNDATIAINYAPTSAAVPAVSDTYGVAIDAYGNAWVTNGGITASSIPASAEELGVDGSALIAPATTYAASSSNGSTSQFGSTLPTTNVRTVSNPKGVAIDLSNRAWIANYGDSATVGTAQTTSSVGVFTGSTSPGTGGTGTAAASSTGYYVGYQPFGVAADGVGDVFVANSAPASATALDGSSLAKLISSPGGGSDGTYTYSTTTTAAAPDSTPGGGTQLVAIDTNSLVPGGIVWVGDSTGCPIKGTYNVLTDFGTASQFGDMTLAPLTDSDVVSSASSATVGAGSSTNCGSASTYVGQTVAALTANVTGVAVDRNNGLWMVDQYVSSSTSGFDGLTYFSAASASSGAVPSSYDLVNGANAPNVGTPGTGTTIATAVGTAVDGNNNVWVANGGSSQDARSVAEASIAAGGAITLLTPGQGGPPYGSIASNATYGIGFIHTLASSTGIAIDSSGNVWVTNDSTSTTTDYTNQQGITTEPIGESVTVIVGAAGPVVTPLALAIKSGKLGSKP